jgi:hypothetical protein
MLNASVWTILTIVVLISPLLVLFGACLYTVIAFDHMNEVEQSIAPERAAATSSIAAVCAAISALLIHFGLPR